MAREDKQTSRGSRDAGRISPDNSEFLKLLSRNRHQLFSFIYSLTPNHNDAEDIFQDASIVMWNKFHEYDEARPFLPWACGISFNIARNFLRSVGRDRLVFSDALLATIAAERSQPSGPDEEQVNLLESCLSKLTSKERSLIDQAYRGDRTVKELAVHLNRATQTIYNRLNLIRRKLVVCVRTNYGTYESEVQ